MPNTRLTFHHEYSLRSSRSRQPCVSRLASMQLLLAWILHIFVFSYLTDKFIPPSNAKLFCSPGSHDCPLYFLDQYCWFAGRRSPTYFPALHHNRDLISRWQPYSLLKANPFYLNYLLSEARPFITALLNPSGRKKRGCFAKHPHISYDLLNRYNFRSMEIFFIYNALEGQSALTMA